MKPFSTHPGSKTFEWLDRSVSNVIAFCDDPKSPTPQPDWLLWKPPTEMNMGRLEAALVTYQRLIRPNFPDHISVSLQIRHRDGGKYSIDQGGVFTLRTYAGLGLIDQANGCAPLLAQCVDNDVYTLVFSNPAHTFEFANFDTITKCELSINECGWKKCGT